jgi:hypothetical protein
VKAVIPLGGVVKKRTEVSLLTYCRVLTEHPADLNKMAQGEIKDVCSKMRWQKEILQNK